MPPTIDPQNIINALFGCCLGQRRRGAADGDSQNGQGSRGNGGHDERTPLLGDQSRAAGAGKAAGRHTVYPDSQRGEGEDGAKGILAGGKDPIRRKKEIDPSKLKAIRDQAHAAFFNVDSSQLLPSSSSLAQQQASQGASQSVGVGGKDQGQSSSGVGGKKGGEAQESYTAAQRKELIAASDKAERLYKAALKAQGAATNLGSPDPQQILSPSPPVQQSQPQPPPPKQTKETKANTAPVGLVRQVRLSVRDFTPVADTASGSRAQLPTDTPAGPSAKAAASRPHFTLSTSSSTLSAQDVVGQSSRQSSYQDVHRLPNVHSLRTLRLGVAPTSPNEADDIMLGQSLTSMATTDEGARSLSTDDESWERRGRTRSKHGLVWMEAAARQQQQEQLEQQQRRGSQGAAETAAASGSGADTKAGLDRATSGAGNTASSRMKLDEIWKAPTTRADEGEAAAATTGYSCRPSPPEPDEIPYALRFDPADDKAELKRRQTGDALKQASTLPIAETWDESGDTSTAS